MLDIEYSRGRCDIRFRFVLFGGILRDWLLLPSLGGGRRFSRYGRHTFARLLMVAVGQKVSRKCQSNKGALLTYE